MKPRTAVLLIVLACLAQMGDSAPRRVEFLRPPRIVSSDDVVQLRVRVQPNPENRAIDVGAYDGEFRVSGDSRQMDGDRGAALWNFNMRFPSGDLMLVAALVNASGKVISRVSTPLCVRGPTDDLCPSLVSQ